MIFNEIRSLFKITSPIIPAGLLLKAIALVDLFFVGTLGGSYLNAHSFIVYIPFMLAPFGRALGLPLVVVLSKEENLQKKINYIISGALISFLVGIFLFFKFMLLKIFTTMKKLYWAFHI